ncbi:hypothetical protein CsSME_00042277 [Camellia sinensis var. sinensis]
MIKFKSNMILFYIVTTIRIGKELNFSLIGKLCFMCELSVWVEWLRTIFKRRAKGEESSECHRFAKYYRSLCLGEWKRSSS